MNSSIRNLHQRLSALLDGTSPIILSTQTTGISKIDLLLKTIESKEPFALSSVKLTPFETHLVLEGVGKFWQLDLAQIKMTFKAIDEKIIPYLEAEPLGGWTIKSFLPNLGPSPGLQESLLYLVDFQKLQFQLTLPDEGKQPQLALYLQADRHGLPAFLRSWMGQVDYLQFGGAINPANPTSNLVLHAALPLNLGKESFKIQSTNLVVSIEEDGQDLITNFALTSQFKLGEELQLNLTGTPNTLPGFPAILKGHFEPAWSIASLGRLLAQLDPNLKNQLDSSIQFPELYLSDVQVMLLDGGTSLANLVLEFTLPDAPWTFNPLNISELAAIQPTQLVLKIDWPLDAYRRQLNTTIYGQTAFFQRSFDLSVAFPERSLSAKMTGTPFHLLNLITSNPFVSVSFDQANLPGLDQLRIRDLSMDLDFEFGNFFIQGPMEGVFSISVPNVNRGLDLNLTSFALSGRVNMPQQTILGFNGAISFAGKPGFTNLAVNPSGLQCSIDLPRIGLTELVSDLLGKPVDLPELHLDKAYISYVHSEINVGGLLDTNLRLPIGQSAIQMQEVWADIHLGDGATEVKLGGQATIGQTSILLDTVLQNSVLALSGEIQEMDLPVLSQELFGINHGVPNIRFERVQFGLSSNGEAWFGAENIQLDFIGIARLLDIRLPVGTPNPVLSLLSGYVTPDSFAFGVQSEAVLAFANGFKASGFQFGITQEATTASRVELEFKVNGQVELAEGCQLDLNMDFEWVSDGTVKVGGTATITFFDATTIHLSAGFVRENEQSILVLTYSGVPIQLVNAKGVFVFDINTLELKLLKEEGFTGFELHGNTSLGIGSLAPIGVTMSLLRQQAGNSLVLRADTDPLVLPSVVFPLPSVGPKPAIQLVLREIGLEYNSQSGKKAPGQIALSAQALLRLEHFAPIDQFMGNSFEGQLKATAESVAVTCAIPTELQGKQWPQINIKISESRKVEVPVPTIQALEIGLLITKGKVAFASEWRTHIPEDLNQWLGTALFADTFDFRLEVGQSIAFWPTGVPNWPFKDLETEHFDGKDWLRFGELRLAIPRFEWQGNAWMVNDLAISGLQSFEIPLKPIKNIFHWLFEDSSAMQSVIQSLPDRVPLGGIDLDAGTLDTQIPQILGEPAMQKLNDLLRPTGKRIEHILGAISDKVTQLPLHLQEYLKLDIPNEGALDFGVTTSGGIKMGLRVDPNRPLRVILPYFGLPPGLLGFTVRGIEIGSGAGGLLLTMGLDGYIDQFDLITLLASTIGKKGGQHYMNRITLNEVFAIAPTAFPIPIPLLFKELGWDLVNPLGFEIHTHWSFGPEEELGLVALFDLIGHLVPFFTKKGHFLHEEGHWPDSLSLPFTIGINNFKLPEYLGGRNPMGLTRALPSYDTTTSIAYLLDALKSLNPGFAILAVPLLVIDEKGKRNWIRVNKLEAGIQFGPIELGAEASWCVATEEEFKGPIAEFAVADGILHPADLDRVFEALPAGAEMSNRGFVIFLLGGWKLKPIVEFQCQFGIAYTGQEGFQTGIRVTATLAQTLAFTMGGTIQLADDRQYIGGDMQLYLTTEQKQVNLLKVEGEIEVLNKPERSFRAKVKLAIGLMSVMGELLISESKFRLLGVLEWDKFVPNGQASVEFSSIGVEVSVGGELGLLKGRLSATLPQFMAAVEIDFNPDFSNLIHQAIVHEANATVDDVIDETYRAFKEATQRVQDFSGSVAEFRTLIVPPICNEVNKMIDNQIAKEIERRISWIPKIGRGVARAGITFAVQQIAKPYKKEVDDLKKAAKKSNAETAKATRSLIKQGQKPLFGFVPLQGENLRQLKNGVYQLDQLKENQQIQITKKQMLDELSQGERIFAQIRASTEDAVEDVVPRIESLRVMNLSLRTIIPEILNAEIVFSGSAAIQIEIYPLNPARTSRSIAQAIQKL